MRRPLLVGLTLLVASTTATAVAAEPVGPGTLVRRVALQPLSGYPAAHGQAQIRRRRDGRSQVVVNAQVPVSTRGVAYEVWLYNSRRDARSLGAQVTDAKGHLVGAGALPRGYRRWRYLDISREGLRGPRSHSGRSVLRGPISPRR